MSAPLVEVMVYSFVSVCVCERRERSERERSVPAVLFAAVEEEPRGVGVALGTGGRFSAVLLSGVCKLQYR